MKLRSRRSTEDRFYDLLWGYLRVRGVIRSNPDGVVAVADFLFGLCPPSLGDRDEVARLFSLALEKGVVVKRPGRGYRLGILPNPKWWQKLPRRKFF
jgi:hypothetical protein